MCVRASSAHCEFQPFIVHVSLKSLSVSLAKSACPSGLVGLPGRLSSSFGSSSSLIARPFFTIRMPLFF